MSDSGLFGLVVLWLIGCTSLLWCIRTGTVSSAGLIPAYLAHLALIHFFGAAIYLFPAYGHVSRTIMILGFVQSLWAVAAFAVGAVALEPRVRRILQSSSATPAAVQPEPSLPAIYIVVGASLYFGTWPLMAAIPTLSAVMSSMFNLFVVGLALSCWKAWSRQRPMSFGLSLAGALSLPFVTILTQGFLGIGVGACLIVLLFVASFYRPRRHVIAGALILCFVAPSFYGTYMRDRTALREVIWGAAPVMERLEVLSNTIGNMEWFNPAAKFDLERIDGRLNQNNLVGAAVDYLDNGYQDFAHGTTIWEAMIALVPRALWPDKPVFAGSGDLVTRYTGIVFAEGTSVGIGQVMEFYVNFGTIGVILGFLLMGGLVATIDRAMAERLASGNWQAFACWFMPGIALLNVGGSLVEITATFGASSLAICIINKFLTVIVSGRARSDISNTPSPELSVMRP